MKLSQAEKAALASTAAFVLVTFGYCIGSLSFGQRPLITVRSEASEGELQTGGSVAASEAYSALADEPVNINTAGVDELRALPGIGDTIARRIVEYREENGDFSDVSDITAVKGIGEGIFSKIKPYITS